MSLLKIQVEEYQSQKPYRGTYTHQFTMTVLDFINAYVEPGPVRKSLLGMVNTEGELCIPAYAERLFRQETKQSAKVEIVLSGNLKRRLKEKNDKEYPYNNGRIRRSELSYYKVKN